MKKPLLCALSLICAFTPSRAAERPPNVVFILSDDHGWQDYGFMGHPHIRTPHLDRLAAQSLVFPRGYVPTPLCCPSLASIVTGRYPHEHRITSNDPPHPNAKTLRAAIDDPGFRAGREKINGYMRDAATMPRRLATLGYMSLQTGKWWQGHFSTGGFTHGMSQDDPKRIARHGDDGLDIGRKTMQPIYDFIAEAQRAEKPFFVWYAPMLPHQPHQPPERLLAKYRDLAPTLQVAKYWAMVEWFDETCGALLTHLDERGLTENTLVCYVADNGWIQNPKADLFDPRSKQSPYDGGLRSPIMVRWPGKIAPRRSEALASSLDFLPTVMAAAGLKPEAGLPGVSLLDDAAVNARTRLFGEVFTHDYVDVASPASSLRHRWIIDGDWKLIVPAPQNEPKRAAELFHLADDPEEKSDRIAAEPERAARMREALDAWWVGK